MIVSHKSARRPDFFIVGAPKCGTTSLARWLSEHAGIYMSPIKEPHYFNSDHGYRNFVQLKDYERLFEAARPQHRAVGEASVWYLYSQRAVPAILEYQPQARFIVCLRNPLEMAPSLHQQQVWAGNEHLQSFAEAWAVQGERLRGRRVRAECREPTHLAYGEVSRLGEQVARLVAMVPSDRVAFVFLDDLRVDAKREYERILQFLGVPSDGRESFPSENPAKVRRFRWLAWLTQKAYQAKLRMGIYRSFGTSRLSTRKAEKAVVPPEVVRDMAAFFADDIALLASLTRRPLGHWLPQDTSA